MKDGFIKYNYLYISIGIVLCVVSFSDAAYAEIRCLPVQTGRPSMVDPDAEAVEAEKKQVLPAVKQQAIKVLRGLDRAQKSARQMFSNLGDSEKTDELIQKLFQIRDNLRDTQAYDPAMERERKRQQFERLFNMNITIDGRSLNELLRQNIKKYVPSLEGTDYIENPAKAFSYLFSVDLKGFFDNVRCIRLKDGRLLTPIETYQEFTGRDPEEVKEMLDIIDDIWQVYSPREKEENRLPALLDAMGRSLRLIKKQL